MEPYGMGHRPRLADRGAMAALKSNRDVETSAVGKAIGDRHAVTYSVQVMPDRSCG
jgi:hypothetical protein